MSAPLRAFGKVSSPDWALLSLPNGCLSQSCFQDRSYPYSTTGLCRMSSYGLYIPQGGARAPKRAHLSDSWSGTLEAKTVGHDKMEPAWHGSWSCPFAESVT